MQEFTRTQLEGSLPSNEKHAINNYAHKQNVISVKKYVHLSNSLMQSYGICHTLPYKNSQLARDLLYESVTYGTNQP